MKPFEALSYIQVRSKDIDGQQWFRLRCRLIETLYADTQMFDGSEVLCGEAMLLRPGTQTQRLTAAVFG